MVTKQGAPPGMNHREGVMKSGMPDSENYTYPDSGCSTATLFLGEQSLCLECPFPLECKKVKIVE